MDKEIQAVREIVEDISGQRKRSQKRDRWRILVDKEKEAEREIVEDISGQRKRSRKIDSGGY